MRVWAVTILAAVTLAACGSEEWRTKDISGLMPPLEFTLADGEDGKPVTEEAFAGDVTLVYFGFTFCPDVCPATLAKLSGVIGELPEDAAEDVRVLFVSVDPKRDDPKRLASYAGAFGPSFIGATGRQEQLREFTKRYRVTYGYGEPDDNGNYPVSHSSAVFVFDREGEARLMFRDDDSPEAMQADLSRIAS